MLSKANGSSTFCWIATQTPKAITANANIAINNSNFGYVLELGRIVMEGDSKELLEKEDIKEFYLGQQDEGIRGERRWKKKKMWR